MKETIDIAEEKLKNIFMNVVGDFDLTRKQGQYERWDSFSHMEIVSEVESQFGVSLDVDEVVKIESAQDILNLLKAK